MQTVSQPNRNIYLVIIGVVVIALLVLVASLFQTFLGSRVLPPNLSEERKKTISGRIGSDPLEFGVHELTVEATLSDGTTIRETREFEIVPTLDRGGDGPTPYDGNQSPSSPYGT